AGAIVTETHTPSTVEDWMIALLVGGFLLFIGASFFIAFTTGPTRALVSGYIAFATAIAATVLGGLNVFAHRESDETETDYDALTAAVEDTYELEAIEYIGSDGMPVLGTDERVPHTDVLCEPTNTNSPEYTGITGDGQQISFKVGVPDCRAENPDVQIVVTKTPGIPLTADQLRK